MGHIPESIEYHLGGFPVVLLMSWITVLLLVIISAAILRKPSRIPSGAQNCFEMSFGFIYDLADSIVGEDAKSFYPLFTGLFFYIFLGNLLGLIPGLISPTANINTTVSLALIVFISTHFFGIRKNGLFKYLGKMTHGVPLWLAPFMFVIELISELARPLSLSFRLFGNLMGKEILLAIFAMLVIVLLPSGDIMKQILSIVPLLLRPAIILLGTLVSFIQAFVFTMLAIIYIGGAVNIEAHH